MADHGGHQIWHIQEMGYSAYGGQGLLYQVCTTGGPSSDNGCYRRPKGMFRGQIRDRRHGVNRSIETRTKRDITSAGVKGPPSNPTFTSRSRSVCITGSTVRCVH